MAKKKVKSSSKKTSSKGKAAKSVASKPKNSIGIEPLGDRVVVKPLSSEEAGHKLPSGILIPETIDKEKTDQGKVVAVGPGKYDDGKLIPMSLKVGDRIMFNKYGYDEIKINGIEYYIVSEANILAILN